MWCSVVQKYGFSCKFQYKIAIFAVQNKKLTKSMEAYKSPLIEIVEMLTEGSILAASTGESFNDQEDFGGSWS